MCALVKQVHIIHNVHTTKQGGCIVQTKDTRLNLKIPKISRDYLSEMAWLNRTSLTNYLLMLIDKDMAVHSDIAKRIKAGKGN